MLFNFNSKTRFFFFNGPTDMRKGINSLYAVVKSSEMDSAFKGDAFIFISSNRKSMKVLRWLKDGFILYHKKLELGQYKLPLCTDNTSFFELKTKTFEEIIGDIHYRSVGNELREHAMLSM